MTDLCDKISEIVRDADYSDDKGCGARVLDPDGIADAILALPEIADIVQAALEVAFEQCASMAKEMDWQDEAGDSPLYFAEDCRNAIRLLIINSETIAAIVAKVMEKK